MFSEDIKKGFPTLVNDPKLVYLDSAASTQTHQSVLDRMDRYYTEQRCNVNRGDFRISQEVSADMEKARESFANLINAKPEQIMFTAGATEGLNMVADWCKDVPVVNPAVNLPCEFVVPEIVVFPDAETTLNLLLTLKLPLVVND